jgi:hypothetical protein
LRSDSCEQRRKAKGKRQKGRVDVSLRYASTSIDDSKGAWGGVAPSSNYGIIGADTTTALLQQGPTRPVSLAVRPSVSSLVGPSEVWAANASIDVSVSRAFRALSPYVGVATSASLAMERSDDVDLDHATAEGSLADAGLSYR